MGYDHFKALFLFSVLRKDGPMIPTLHFLILLSIFPVPILPLYLDWERNSIIVLSVPSVPCADFSLALECMEVLTSTLSTRCCWRLNPGKSSQSSAKSFPYWNRHIWTILRLWVLFQTSLSDGLASLDAAPAREKRCLLPAIGEEARSYLASASIRG